jgi:hypothetical protein
MHTSESEQNNKTTFDIFLALDVIDAINRSALAFSWCAFRHHRPFGSGIACSNGTLNIMMI